MENNRNYYLAIVLSVLIVFAWQFFLWVRKWKPSRRSRSSARPNSPNSRRPIRPRRRRPALDQSGQPIPGANGQTVAVVTREQALSQTSRIVIDTPALTGSISLAGARFDDLRLKNYRETIDKDSPIITLLSPGNTKDGYFVELGFLGAQNLPGMTTNWTVEGANRLTQSTPVTLSYTNPEGVTFTRKISVDDKYMFQIEDSVKNGSAAALSLTPYGRVVRYNQPTHASAWVLHEGYVGVMDGSLKEETFGKATSEPVKFDAPQGGWFGITDKYWAATIVPQKNSAFTSQFSHVETGQPLFQPTIAKTPPPAWPRRDEDLLDHGVRRRQAGARDRGL